MVVFYILISISTTVFIQLLNLDLLATLTYQALAFFPIRTIACRTFLSYAKEQKIEGFSTAPQLPLDAENPNLTNGDVFGMVPAAASASIFKKKDARDKAKNENLPYDKSTGQFYIESLGIDLNPDPNDIQSILEKELNTTGSATATTTVKKSGFKDYHPYATVEGFESPQQIAAQAKLNEGNINEAITDYVTLIKQGQRLDEIIDDLNLAFEKYPEDSSIIQALGDAYMQANRLQEALDAYTKAGELLK